MSSFSLVISPPDRSRAGFTEKTLSCATAYGYLSTFTRTKQTLSDNKDKSYVTLRSATMQLMHPKLRLMA
jgi:hypothetical protein